MVRFSVTCTVVVLVLFFGVLLGMQTANDGIKKMKGYDESTLSSAFEVNQSQGELEASILGEQVTSHDVEKKKEQLEEMKAFNFFSAIGKKLSEAISMICSRLLDLLKQDSRDKQTSIRNKIEKS